MWCDAWARDDVDRRLEDVKHLIASDNWDADEVMVDDEMAVFRRISEAVVLQKNLPSGAIGVGVADVVIEYFKKFCSIAWRNRDL